MEEIDKFKAIPNCFLAKNDIIVLQDLCFHGYQMNNRKLDLSYDTSLVIIKELAKFHALSLGLKIQDPDRFFSVINNDNGIRETYFTSENEEWYRDYYEIASRNALDMVYLLFFIYKIITISCLCLFLGETDIGRKSNQ